MSNARQNTRKKPTKTRNTPCLGLRFGCKRRSQAATRSYYRCEECKTRALDFQRLLFKPHGKILDGQKGLTKFKIPGTAKQSVLSVLIFTKIFQLKYHTPVVSQNDTSMIIDGEWLDLVVCVDGKQANDAVQRHQELRKVGDIIPAASLQKYKGWGLRYLSDKHKLEPMGMDGKGDFVINKKRPGELLLCRSFLKDQVAAFELDTLPDSSTTESQSLPVNPSYSLRKRKRQRETIVVDDSSSDSDDEAAQKPAQILCSLGSAKTSPTTSPHSSAPSSPKYFPQLSNPSLAETLEKNITLLAKPPNFDRQISNNNNNVNININHSSSSDYIQEEPPIKQQKLTNRLKTVNYKMCKLPAPQRPISQHSASQRSAPQRPIPQRSTPQRPTPTFPGPQSHTHHHHPPLQRPTPPHRPTPQRPTPQRPISHTQTLNLPAGSFPYRAYPFSHSQLMTQSLHGYARSVATTLQRQLASLNRPASAVDLTVPSDSAAQLHQSRSGPLPIQHSDRRPTLHSGPYAPQHSGPQPTQHSGPQPTQRSGPQPTQQSRPKSIESPTLAAVNASRTNMSSLKHFNIGIREWTTDMLVAWFGQIDFGEHTREYQQNIKRLGLLGREIVDIDDEKLIRELNVQSSIHRNRIYERIEEECDFRKAKSSSQRKPTRLSTCISQLQDGKHFRDINVKHAKREFKDIQQQIKTLQQKAQLLARQIDSYKNDG